MIETMTRAHIEIHLVRRLARVHDGVVAEGPRGLEEGDGRGRLALRVEVDQYLGAALRRYHGRLEEPRLLQFTKTLESFLLKFAGSASSPEMW